MGSNHMHDSMKESEKYNEINFLNTTTKLKVDKEADAKAVISAMEERYDEKNKSNLEATKKMNDELTARITAEPMLISPSEPKRKNQYIVKIDGLELESFCYQNVIRPNMYPSGWGEMEIEILDLIGEDVHTKLNSLLEKQKTFFGGNNWGLNIEIDELSPSGGLVDKWKYKTILNRIEYCDLTYSSSELGKIKLILSVKSVIHKSN